jgi:hypothetical protein
MFLESPDVPTGTSADLQSSSLGHNTPSTPIPTVQQRRRLAIDPPYIIRAGNDLQSACLARMMLVTPALRQRAKVWTNLNTEKRTTMNSKAKLALGILTAMAMFLLTFTLPRGSGMRDAVLVQFPITVGVWAIFVLLFVKLK